MRYFSVEKEVLEISSVSRYSVDSSGEQTQGAYGVDSEDNPRTITAGFLVQYYSEEGLLEEVKFYPVATDTTSYQDNSDEVLKQILADHPATEYQNNEW